MKVELRWFCAGAFAAFVLGLLCQAALESFHIVTTGSALGYGIGAAVTAGLAILIDMRRR